MFGDITMREEILEKLMPITSEERKILDGDGDIDRALYMDGQGSTHVVINDYKPKCRLEKRVYSCPTEDYPSSEIIDMR